MNKIFLATIITVFSTIAFGAGDAGCGLGSMIISKNSKGLQLLAMTTNGSFSSQFFGITFGTSNCSSSGIVSNEKKVEHFVEANQSEILKEMSMGTGEKLETLASLYGCDSAQAKQEFKILTKSEFELINKSTQNSYEWVQNFNSVIGANRDKISQCQSI